MPAHARTYVLIWLNMLKVFQRSGLNFKTLESNYESYIKKAKEKYQKEKKNRPHPWIHFFYKTKLDLKCKKIALDIFAFVKEFEWNLDVRVKGKYKRKQFKNKQTMVSRGQCMKGSKTRTLSSGHHKWVVGRRCWTWINYYARLSLFLFSLFFLFILDDV